MTILARGGYDDDLQALLDAPGGDLEVWTFDDAPTRRAAEAEFARRGIRARCRSALKPLVCAMAEEVPLRDLRRLHVTWPRPEGAAPGRFLLEAWPLAAMLPGVELRFRAGRPAAAGMPAYRLVLDFRDGTRRRMRVAAPNRMVVDAHGRARLSSCGWLIRGGVSAPLATWPERMLQKIHARLPSFPVQRLRIRVETPFRDQPLPGGAHLSLTEILHEEIYFSVLEHAQARAGQAPGDRRLRPGQIVPEMVPAAHPALLMAAEPWQPDPPPPEQPPPEQPLARALAALSASQIACELQALGGEGRAARSAAGREVGWRYLPGAGRAMLLTAGQHANEISGPIGALRAARVLARRGAHLAVCPLENPDGYALRAELAAADPGHMLHAARYTALGDDLEYRTPPLHESAVRAQARLRSGALLHVSLHGYPAHEFARPFSGYLPAGFESWTLPRGMFLILRHWPGWEGAGLALLRAVAARLGAHPGLAGLNLCQRVARSRYLKGGAPARMLHGLEVILRPEPSQPLPLMLITEYPDETLQGPALRLAHHAQCLAVLAAYAALQGLDLPRRGRDAAAV
ncbi:MAG: peptidase M14 [Paracoccus sp. (in: a-proteobacteria)]|uniref:peptidase M14 n=1 Tax=Paracoccus sp. TaxID=267 RepID=UPI0039E57CE7